MSLEGVLLKLQQLFVKETSFHSHAIRIANYRERLLDPIRLLIMGQFSSGKSSLINTLLRQNILPTGAVPTTAVATYMRYSEEDYIEIVYQNGEVERTSLIFLHKTTSERHEQGKQLRSNIERINLYLCNDFLRDLVLIDTPGLNSPNAAHNEQALNAYDEADDGLWIFKYNSVGRASEINMLKTLQNKGLHPLGVINMIDEAEVDDVTPYLTYEFQKLEGRVREIVGVSAIEAQEAMETDDDDLFRISGFPKLLTEIEDIKKDDTRKQQRFQDSFLIYWKKLIEDVESLLQSTPYIKSVEKLQQFSSDVKEENAVLNNEWESREELLLNEHNTLQDKINARYSMKQWIATDVHQALRGKYEEFKQWEATLQLYERLRTENQNFAKEVSEFEQFFQTEIGAGKNFSAPRNLYRIARERKRALKITFNQLKKEIKEINHKLNVMEKQRDELMPNIIAYFEQQVASLKQQLDTLSSEQAKQQEENKKSVITATKIVSQWKYLKNIREQLLQIQQYISEAKLTDSLSSPYLHEVELESTENAIMQLNTSMYKMRLQIKDLDCTSIEIGIPEQLPSPATLPSQLLYSFKPVLFVVAVASVLYLGVVFKDDVKYMVDEVVTATSQVSDDYFSDDTSDEYENSEQSEDSTPYEQTFIEYSIGTIYDNGYETPVYNRASENGEIIAYLDDLEYEVSHLTENGWMKVGEDAWVAYHNEMDFYQHELESALSTSNGSIRTEQVAADFIPVFESDSRDSAVIGFLEDESDVAIFEMPNSKWANIGNNAWIEADKYLHIDWTFTPVAEGEPIGEIEVLANALNVRQSDKKESNLIGQVSKGDTLYVYDTSQSNGWYSLGEYGWVSNDDNYVSYTSYEDEMMDYEEGSYEDEMMDYEEDSYEEDNYEEDNSSETPIGYIEVLSDIPLYDYSDNITGELPSGTITDVYEYSEYDNSYRINETDWLYMDEGSVVFYSY
ncbi:dynamin family protein [Bacillus sp. JJ634]